MKNLIKQIATSLILTLVAVSLVVITPDHAQAKVKKQPGNSAKVKSHATRGFYLESAWPAKSHAKRLSVSDGFAVDIGTTEKVRLHAAGASPKTTKRTRQ